MSGTSYATGMAVFIFAYMLAQVPVSHRFDRVVRPARFIAVTVLAWGCVSFSMALAQSCASSIA